MADCECLPVCPFFRDKMADKQGMTPIYKGRYCQGDNSRCARYQVSQAVGQSEMPADLYPNERDRVAALIAVHEARQQVAAGIRGDQAAGR